MFTTLALTIVLTGLPYEKLNDQDAKIDKATVQAFIKELREQQKSNKPLTEREKKRQAYLAQKASKRRVAGLTSKTPTQTFNDKLPYEVNEYGTIFTVPTYNKAKKNSFFQFSIKQILSKNSVLVGETIGESYVGGPGLGWKYHIVEGIDTTKADIKEGGYLSGVFVLVNKATYNTTIGTKTVSVFKKVAELEGPNLQQKDD